MSPNDPGRARRLWCSIAFSMGVASVFGFAGFAVGAICRSVAEGIATGVNTAAVVFWILFPILLVTHVLKSAAVLEFERRVRFAEELFKRSRESR